MQAIERIRDICEILQARGEAGTPYQVAQILAIAPSTVCRWLHGQSAPAGTCRESLEVLHRICNQVRRGNPTAVRMLTAAMGPSQPLRLGLRGAIIAAGLDWLLTDA